MHTFVNSYEISSMSHFHLISTCLSLRVYNSLLAPLSSLPHVTFSVPLFPPTLQILPLLEYSLLSTTMSTSNASIQPTSYSYKNIIYLLISEILTTIVYEFNWLQESNILYLVSMGTFLNDIPLLDMIMNFFTIRTQM